MNIFNLDLEFYQNNGTIAIRPLMTGRLKKLCLTTKKGFERVWVFKSVVPYMDSDGDERIDHGTRGVVNGTFNEGIQFINMCRELGLVAQSSGIFVPFSNGKHRYGVEYGESELPINDYSEDELKLMRWDLPTRDQLLQLKIKGIA